LPSLLSVAFISTEDTYVRSNWCQRYLFTAAIFAVVCLWQNDNQP